MTQPAKPYTITTHWHPGKRHDLNEPVTDTAPDWPTARTMALRLTTLRATAAVVVHDPDGELIANWDVYSNLWREPRPQPKFIDTLVDVARARVLAADYQANPTRARAHNAAQILWDVLGTLDAVIARTFTITDENTQLANVTAELARVRTEIATLCRNAESVVGNKPPFGTCRAWTLDPATVEAALGLATGGIVDPTTTHRIGES